jgi:hypothetical protein
MRRHHVAGGYVSVPPGPYRLFAECVGNPDFRQFAPICEDLRVEVPDFQQASRQLRKWIEFENLGGGNLGRCVLVDDHGVVVATLSYNGRVWPPGVWERGKGTLYEPTREDLEWAMREARKAEDQLLAATMPKKRKAVRRRAYAKERKQR